MISARRVVTFQPSLILKAGVNSVAAEQPDAVMRTQGKGLVSKGKRLGASLASASMFWVNRDDEEGGQSCQLIH